MAGNKLTVASQQFRRPAGNILMRSPVSAVTANLMRFILFNRQWIKISFFRHALMKSSVKSGNLFNIRQSVFNRLNSQNRRRIMQRSQNRQLINFLQNLIRNQNRLVKETAALNHAVPDAVQLVKTLQCAVQKQIQNFFNSFVVRRQSDIFNDFVAVTYFNADKRTVNTDTFGIAFCYNFIFIAINIKQLIFQRRRT